MLLYHYSREYYPLLKSKRLLQMFTMNELRRAVELSNDNYTAGQYLDHISLFFDPIPVKEIGNLFNSNHPVWFNGNKLYEYVVDISDVVNIVGYDVVETPSELSILDATVWDYDDPDFTKRYLAEAANRKLANGTQGYTLEGLLNQIKLYKGTTEYHYRNAVKRKDFSDNRFKCAAAVPHVMLYPVGSKLHYRNVNKVIIGKDGVIQ